MTHDVERERIEAAQGLLTHSRTLQHDADDTAIRADHLERARKLGRRLQVEVMIDITGWLRNEIEVVVHKERDGTLRPIRVRVGADACDDAVLERGGVVTACLEYNTAIGRLRRLAERLTYLVRQGRVRLDTRSPLAHAYHELSRLDELLAHRQRITVGHRTIRLATLRREAELFARWDAHLTPVVLAAEDATTASAVHKPAGAHKWWDWSRWWPARNTAPHLRQGPRSKT